MSDGRAQRWRGLLGRTALGVFLSGCLMIVIDGASDGGPIDYRMVATVAAVAMAASAVVLLPAFTIWLSRTRTLPPLPPPMVVALVAVGMAAVAGVVVWRGVVTPWAPVATATDAACPALERAGVGQSWPGTPRTRSRDDVHHNDIGVFSYCGWTSDYTVDPPPFMIINSFVRLYDGTRTGTALGWAADGYRDQHDEATRARTLDGIGDEAFVADAGDTVGVTARRANVLVHVEISPSTADTARVAEDLVRRMTAAVRTS
jgi:hypothetical protein